MLKLSWLLVLAFLVVILTESIGAVTLPLNAIHQKMRQKYRAEKMAEYLGSHEEYERMKQSSDAQQFWFTQRYDHFEVTKDSQKVTFQQRYWINDSYWQPGTNSPIFVQLGEEAPCDSSYVNSMAMTQYGSQVGALLIAIEHRGYGLSSFAPNMGTPYMKLLSVDQAMADYAAVIRYVRDVQYNTTLSPIIVFGCSYIGAGASWFRQRFGHLALGAIASSAPVQAVVDFTQYLDEVNFEMKKLYGNECDKVMRNVTTQIANLLSTKQGTSQVLDMFGVCAPFNGDKDIQTFWSAIVGNPWMGAAQYYNEGLYPPLKDLCSDLVNAKNPLDKFASLSLQYNNPNGTCLDASYNDTIVFMQNLDWNSAAADSRSWVWQTCSQFGYYQTTDSPNQPFGNGIPISYYTDMCNDIYQMPFLLDENIANTNNKFGGQNLPPYSYTNCVFDGTRWGVWQTLAPQKSVSKSVPLYLYESEGHCAGVFPLTKNTPPDIVQVHKQIFAEIQKWLADYYASLL